MRRRRQRSERPEEAFLRALRARGEPVAQAQRHEDDGDGRPEGEPAAGPPPGVKEPVRPQAAQPEAAEVVDPQVSAELERRAAAAEAALEEVRAEAERRLAETRAAIAREHEARLAAERRGAEQAEAAQPAETEPERSEDAQRELAESLQRRLEAVAESERRLREEREHWESDAQRHAERRAAELADAERRIAEARALLRQESASMRAQPELGQVAAAADEPPSAPAQGYEAPPERQLEPAEARDAPEPPSGLVLPSPAAHGPIARLRSRRGSRGRIVCATCARELAGPVSRAGASGWTVNRKGSALCDECQKEGWHFPDGAALPFRRPAGHDTPASPQR